MKLRITLLWVIAVIMGALAFTACSQDVIPEVISEANLLGLSVVKGNAGRTALQISSVPAPIPAADWNNEEYSLAGADFGTIYVKAKTDTEEGLILGPIVSAGARVQWGKARAGNRPDVFTDPRVPAEFKENDFIYIKVTSADGAITNYYRFYSVVASPVKEMVNLSISGRETDKVGSPAVDVEDLANSVKLGATNFFGTVEVTIGEALNALVLPTPAQEHATFQYATAPSLTQATQIGEFQASNRITFTDGNILYIKVTAQNEEDFNYYAFRVTVGRIAAIKGLWLDGVEVVGPGTNHTVWANVVPGSFASADQKSGGFAVTVTLEDPSGECDWALMANTAAAQPAYGKPAKVEFQNNNALAIRVQSGRGNSVDTRYYKIQITLLAANFTQQPKSDVYWIESHTLQTTPVVFTVKDSEGNDVTQTEDRVLIDAAGNISLDRAIKALSFTLDRTPPGATYQWYESNSWYGGYGFDREGRIYHDPGYGTDCANQAEKDLYGSGLSWDEKSNISLHNGGNNYYRLTVPGRPISGETGATYTPKITAKNRPVITGFSNSTHYYWVVITDSNGLKVTSARAAIIAEWKREWNHGKEITEKIVEGETVQVPKQDIKHYIVDLYAKTGTGDGLKGDPKNPTPFTAGNHGDKYAVPITFPAGFNIMEYSIVTCQAKFYLADGREWIQNWTQGDFGFEKNGERQVLWYNLTNDNGTRGLDKTGNDPISGSLDSNPTHVIIQPAGTKPLKEMPPFQSNGQPQNTGDAQGWFTPYIEIVELRFEGPTRITAP